MSAIEDDQGRVAIPEEGGTGQVREPDVAAVAEARPEATDREITAPHGLSDEPSGGELPTSRDWASEVAALDARASETSDPLARRDILLELARIYEKEQGQADLAFIALGRAFRDDPANPQLRAELERVADLAEAREELLEIYEEELERSSAPAIMAPLMLKVGEMLEPVDADRALSYYENARALDPAGTQAALPALERHYRRKERWDRLADVLGQMGRADEAARGFEEVLERDPKNLQALIALRDLHSARGEQEALALVLRRLIPLQEDVGAVKASRLQLAHALVGLDRREEAIEAVDRGLDLEPRTALELEQAEGLFRQLSAWSECLRAMDLRAELLAIDRPGEAMALWAAIADLHTNVFKRPEGGAAALEKMLQLDPTNDGIAASLEQLYVQASDWPGQAASLDRRIHGLSEPARQLPLLEKLAQIQEEHLGDAAAAEASLRRALGLDPANPATLEQLGGLLRRRGRTAELVVVLEQRAELAGTPEQKKPLLRELASCYEELGEADDAVAALHRGLELDGRDTSLIRELAAIYQREQAWPDLVALLQQARDQLGDLAERAALQLRIAEITEQGLEEDEAAISAYEAVLELDPLSRPALTALDRLYARNDRRAQQIQVYDRLAALAEPQERLGLLLSAAKALESSGALAEAVARLEAALEVDPQAVIVLLDLERLYRQAADWDRLVATLQRHLVVATDAAEKLGLQISLGELWAQALARPDLAEPALRRALELDPQSRTALHLLGELYEQRGAWPEALEMLAHEIQLAPDGPQAVQLNFRAGSILAEKLGDGARAAAMLERCLELDPSHLPSLLALRKIHGEAKNEAAYLEALKRGAEVATEPAQKADLFWEQGSFYQSVKEDVVCAEQRYLDAIHCVPGHLPSVRALADLYQARGDWQNAEEMIDILVETPGSDPDACRLYYRSGYVADKLQKQDKALAAYRRAHELDSSYLPVLEGLGQLLVRTGAYEEALGIYDTILRHHREALANRELGEIHWQIGAIHRGLERPDRALESFERALELDPSHGPSRQALIEIFEAAGRYDSALEHRQRLLETLEGEPRFAMCVAIARLSRDQLGDPYQAIDAFWQALEAVPEDRETLEAVLALCLETKQAGKAVEVLLRMVALPVAQVDPRIRRQWHFQLAGLYRDELKDEAKAVAQLNLALDADPMFSDAMAALETMLTAKRAWPELEQSYHAVIKRLPKTPETQPARMALWRNLGELYRRVLKNIDGAITAYEVVAKGNPEDIQVVEILAQLYSKKPGMEAQAVEAHRKSLLNTAHPAQNVKALARLHAVRKEYDEAYITSQVAVSLLGDRDPEEEQIVERLKRHARDTANGSMTDRLWTEHLYHERLRGPMAEVLSICQEATGGAFAVDLARLNVNAKRDRVDVAQSPLFFVNTYKYVAHALSMETAGLFKVPGASGLALGNSWPVCFLAGEDMFQDRPKKELCFAIAKAMAFSRPELAMARLHPPEELEAIFQSALCLAVPTFRATADPEELQKQGRKLEKGLSEAARPALVRAAQQCLQDPNQTELRGYIEAVEHTANRAGILLSVDVAVAKRCLAKDPGVAARLPERSKVRDLMLFCLSQSFFSLRKELGLAIDIPTEGRAAS